MGLGAYAWLANTLDPEEGAVRLAVLAAIATMLLVSLAAPGGAFEATPGLLSITRNTTARSAAIGSGQEREIVVSGTTPR